MTGGVNGARKVSVNTVFRVPNREYEAFLNSPEVYEGRAPHPWGWGVGDPAIVWPSYGKWFIRETTDKQFFTMFPDEFTVFLDRLGVNSETRGEIV